MAATTKLDFGAQISDWARKSEARMLAVLRESTQRVVSKAQSRIPVDSGFARASIQASLSGMPPVGSGKPAKGQSYAYNGGAVVGVIAQAKIGDVIHVGWTANYAGVLENGHSQQAPSGFVAISVMEWAAIVRAVTAEAQAIAGGG